MNVRNESKSKAARRLASRVANRLAYSLRALMWGCKIPTVIKPEYLDSQVDPIAGVITSQLWGTQKKDKNRN